MLKGNCKTLVPLMHFIINKFVWFEHTQRNVPKRCVDLPKLKPENSWTQNYEAKQWNHWLFRSIITSEITLLVTLSHQDTLTCSNHYSSGWTVSRWSSVFSSAYSCGSLYTGSGMDKFSILNHVHYGWVSINTFNRCAW